METGPLSQAELERVAHALGTCMLPGQFLWLFGEMGAGKTTFVRALAHGLGVDAPARVCSPTFAVAMLHAGATPLRHVDLYRLQLHEHAPASFDALELEGDDGLGEGVDAREVVTAVEWSECWPSVRQRGLCVEIYRPRGVVDSRMVRSHALDSEHETLHTRWKNALCDEKTS